MPKDASKNIDRYKVRGGELNEYDFEKEKAAEKKQDFANKKPQHMTTPPQEVNTTRQKANPTQQKTSDKAGKKK